MSMSACVKVSLLWFVEWLTCTQHMTNNKKKQHTPSWVTCTGMDAWECPIANASQIFHPVKHIQAQTKSITRCLDHLSGGSTRC